MREIGSFRIGQLRTEEDFGFHKMVVAETELLTAGTDSPEGISLMAAGTVSPLVTAAITAYKTAYAAFDSALKESNSVPSASTASDADGTRDEAWRGTNGYVKALLYHPQATVRAYAGEAKALIDKYGDPTGLSQTQESGILHNLLQDLKALDEEKRTATNLDVWITDLEEKEEAFLAAAQRRNDEKSKRVLGIVKQARQTADDAFRRLTNTVNLVAEAEGEEPYAGFMDRVNVLIDQQKAVLKARATLNAKKKEEEEEKPGTDLSSLENNLVVMRILDAAIRSAREKRVIPLDN